MRTEISDGRILVRRYRQGDALGLYIAIMESMPMLSSWTNWAYPGYALSDAQDWVDQSVKLWDEHKEYHFVVTLNGNEEIIGGCGLNNIDRANNRANLGYWVKTEKTGQGVGTAAALLTARFGLEDCIFSRIEVCVSTSNAASLRVAENSGARKEGVFRNRLRVGGRQHDAVMFSFVPGDI